jgi:hypothetical protein
MGTKNRERRRVKQRKRQQRHGEPSSSSTENGRSAGPHRGAPDDLIDHYILAAAYCECADPSHRASAVGLLVAGQLVGGPARVADRLSSLLAQALAIELEHNWGPADLWHVLRRKAGQGSGPLAVAALGIAIRRSSFLRQQEQWAGEVAGLGDTARTVDPGQLSWPTDVKLIVSMIRVLNGLRPLADLGTVWRADRRKNAEVDNRVLIRIRALLAKAESSDFEEEADAFMSKAQELMTRHRLDRALVEDDDASGSPPAIEARRCWLEDPYVPAKGLLLSVVGKANRCQCVSNDAIGMVTIIGHPDDLDITEVLFTSLLFQATRRMTALGSRSGSTDCAAQHARRPAFRRSFLVAFAIRIGKRLQQVAETATNAAADDLGDRLLPVLARHDEAVDRVVQQLFPSLVRSRLAASDGRGWAAGTAAADLADLDVRPGLGFADEAAS